MKRVLLIVFLIGGPLCVAKADLLEFPIANFGVGYPNGFEATDGRIWGTPEAPRIHGVTASVRGHMNDAAWGLSAGPGYIDEVDFAGMGAHLWGTQLFSWQGRLLANQVSVEGYLRLLAIELRLGLLTTLPFEGDPLKLSPVVAINVGI